jgi:hypothetical protein
MNTTEYDKVSYKKYKAYCLMERQELVDNGADVDFQMISFDEFLKKMKEDSKFAKVWGYWNFI